MSELDKLQKALSTALARSIGGQSRLLFDALQDLRLARDLSEGRLSRGERGLEITGTGEFCRDAVKEAYTVLGIAQAA